jgi:arylsulfatase A-like enzyme
MLKNKKYLLISVILLIAGGFLLLNRKSAPRNVIYIMVDTLRADHLGFNGYERETSPAIDSFAKENLNFTYAISPVPWTPPSVASQLSGLYSVTHNMLPPRSRGKAKTRSLNFNSNIITLPEALKKNGYFTSAVSPNPWISGEFGYDKEFDEFQFINRARAEEVNQVAFKVIDKLSGGDKPFFLYLHYLDPHDPYKPPKEFAKFFKEKLKVGNYSEADQKRLMRYDGEIRYLDGQIGLLLNYLKTKGLYNNSLIIFTADHGEQFNEHGDLGHGYQLFNEEIHVPLIFKLPKNSKFGINDEKVSLIDIFPTVLDILGFKTVEGLQGISLLDSKKITDRKGVMSEIGRVYFEKALISSRNHKLIVGVKTEEEALELNDASVFENIVGIFKSGPGASEDKFEPAPGDLHSNTVLKEIYENSKKAKITATNEHSNVSDETLDQLQTLGYF